MQQDQRSLSNAEALELNPGDQHYRAYVGPPEHFDVMGSTQFRLLATLGLREQHRVLDIGCGSLRLGQLLIPYLAPGNYTGLDPNQWLIDDAIDRQLGADIIRIKQPKFFHHDDFSLSPCGSGFDFIVAQSILSHTGADLAQVLLDGIQPALSDDGIALVTFVEHNQVMDLGSARSGWVYPYCVTFDEGSVDAMAAKAGLVQRPIPWFHPRQTWYAMARSADALPSPEHDHLLQGAVLRSEELKASIPTPD